ncbi:MAG TPA: rhodanese-like domain-containing protein [Bacteroidia bacterium]|jgi:thiosulfate/3-mercaptopyruvate sulfurtransferase|nr:rhodanese-like domain-containing protein [Bacteroidia bacterium]
MKKIYSTLAAIFIIANSFAQQNPWKKDQIMLTKYLVMKIQSKSGDMPVILNVGPMENIKTAIKIGATNTTAGMNNLKSITANIDKNKEVVIYCGCCSYDNCPNIRPAFQMLQELGFKKVKVLDIPEGIKPDWVAKDYPVE